ncbi:SAM-dependent methyltransferase [Streptococcus sp. IsoGale022]|uniref:methyltransferase domain-containing protein n=1 Tax=Streptococcus sp. IsoGale022 TaxID=2923524 RepID=UPI00280D80DA|nr:methyltransferase domain-containing protein [Streptococcus sp. IsoGale022]MDQ8692384.1 SAM-dependent methyltransferase [Streptococcus sp. IsoGale022]
MKEFKNKDYATEIRQKIPGYDVMLDVIFRGVLLRLAPSLKVDKVLALASQTDELNGLASLFPKAGLTVVEPGEAMLQELKRQVHLPQAEYLNCRFEEAVLPSAYQICSCLLVLQFVENTSFFLRKIYDSLSEGGLLILSFFSNQQLGYWKTLASELGANQQQIQRTYKNQASLMNSLSPQEVANLLEEAGFTNIEQVCQVLSTFVWIIRK